MSHSTISLFAYIDPGTGSLIFQVLAATIMGIVVAFQSVRLWFLNLFSKLPWSKNNNSKSSTDTQTNLKDEPEDETSHTDSSSRNK